MTFTELGLSAPILKTLSNNDYSTPTPIQAQAIPAVLEGRDIVGLAQTGTGKTAAFSLPILHRLSANIPSGPRKIRALILAPTRELATQINDAIWTYSKGLGLRSAFVIGGVPIKKQKKQLADGVDILVATPGRLEDLIAQKACSLKSIETVVLDEADQMLDIGFMPAIRRLLSQMPKKRQTLLFSATMPKEISSLANDYLTDPVHTSVNVVSKTADRIDQTVIHMENGAKPTAIFKLVQQHPGKRVIVFCRTKRGSDKVAKKLGAEGIGADAIHGNKSQGQRQRALDAFRKGDKPVLIATDIAARGIDIREVEVVVNYDLPNVPEAYVHRIGRTARAGASGFAVAFCSPEEQKLLRDIEKVIKMKIPAKMADGSPVPNVHRPIERTKPKNNRRGGRGGAVTGKGEKPEGNPNKKPWHKRRTSKLDANGNIVAIDPNAKGPKGKRPRRRKPSGPKVAAS
ncbi:DEAD/DEAH box helicase [Amylibacter sp. IMCC11727]|uniref:DEAD/DEAH box helicase n=1 Tax=Amylibacter sp. IMCC11727 TaxID=3039851 RepID=UPI00244DE16F|nr:DEAD/DEAH box helicase [Amylibacter sp. IMCC11727]WGI20371.1 DEAD/DEAH box helicase [Amylibacter sp. IMCC11727]